ncbi:tRNA lysidine(34) synthetase TilS [Microbulbifer hainanensis]|uniref:tRNA lysidine(34) synthetase TilS n=1 Tax=Microbulbifer hainanensis TaxID=2735675 RepID=UPI0029BFB3AE|nr:tRNA lysidine(34) synthetase TilS [Microbulbifer hainanensis]
MSVELPEIVAAALSRHPCAGVRWVAYSGGLDSSVLLHILARLRLPVRAIHVHHGLSANADAWQEHCVSTAESLGIPIEVRRVAVDSGDGGLEQGARRARYHVFAELLQPGDQLLLAQHGDDQAETFLLRLLRGSGALGLAAMAESRQLECEGGSTATLLRPLLGTGRDQLESYARAEGLSWIEDESNRDLSLERNFLRARVLPPLRERWPVRERVARAASNLREAADLLQDLGDVDLLACDRREERFGESIDLKLLCQLPPRRRKNLLRTWLTRLGGDMPAAVHLEEALDQAMAAAEDSELAVSLVGRVVRRYRNRLYLTPQLPQALATGDWSWRGDRTLLLPQGWELRPGAAWPAGDYRVHFRRGGERAQPLGRAHSQRLKKLLQETGLEPWLRDRVPLVYRADAPESLLAVGDLFRCEEGLPDALEWRYCGLPTAI